MPLNQYSGGESQSTIKMALLCILVCAAYQIAISFVPWSIIYSKTKLPALSGSYNVFPTLTVTTVVIAPSDPISINTVTVTPSDPTSVNTIIVTPSNPVVILSEPTYTHIAGSIPADSEVSHRLPPELPHGIAGIID